MNISSVKASISGWKDKVLQFNKSESKPDAQGVITTWVNGWDNDTRTRVSMTEEVFNEIKAKGDNLNTLGVMSQTKISKTEGNKEYTQYIVYAYTAGDAGEL